MGGGKGAVDLSWHVAAQGRLEGGLGQCGLGRPAGYTDGSVHSRVQKTKRDAVQRGIDEGGPWHEGIDMGTASREVEKGWGEVGGRSETASGLVFVLPARLRGTCSYLRWDTRAHRSVVLRGTVSAIVALPLLRDDMSSDM